MQINPDLGDTITVTRLPGQKFRVSFWYRLDGGPKTQFQFTLPDDYAALTQQQQDALLFEWALAAARITGTFP